MRDWAHSRRLGTPADEAGYVVLRQPQDSIETQLRQVMCENGKLRLRENRRQDQTAAAVFRYSAIGPKARTGRKERAPMSKTVPNTRIPKVMVSLGSVPMVSAFRPWRAKRPASSSARAASTNRPAIMANIVVML